MTQYMRPSSDINTGWKCSTGSDRFALIDEETYSDSDYIYGYSSASQECKLSSPDAPLRLGTGLLRFRAKVVSGEITPSIKCGATTIKTGTAISGTSYSEYTVSLSQSEMDSVTDWTDVRVVFLSDSTAAYKYVSWVVLEVPDKASAVGLELGCSF